MDGMKLFAIYLAVMNVIGVAVMWSDKKRARLHRWRIPEKVLFGVSLLGGSAGTWAGMYLFRHKTKHWYFVAVQDPAALEEWPECRSFWFARRHLRFIWCAYMFYNKLL